MFWLISRLLPFALLLLGAFLLIASLPTVIGGAETASIPIAVADVTTTSPPARWLKLTGGGLYLPDTILDEQVKTKTGARKVTAYYVPYLLESEAITRAKASTGAVGDSAGKGAASVGAAAPPKMVVLVRFAPDDFLRSYPSTSNLTPDDVYRPTLIEGMRASSVLFPERLKDYVRAELKMPLDSVVVLKAHEKPLQRREAIGFAGAGGAIALIGLLWSIARLRRRPTGLPMPAPGAPTFPPALFPAPPLRPTSPPPPLPVR